MTTITFLRSRPAGEVTTLLADTRRREGTTALEMASSRPEDTEAALAAGLLTVVVGPSPVEGAGWVLGAGDAFPASVPGWRLTVIDDPDRPERVLDALARSGAAFLRTARSEVAATVARTRLPGLTVAVSVFVDDVPSAVAAVAAGATDLVLRDWDVERLGELREALGGYQLLERTVFPVGLEVDEARRVLPSAVFTTWLGQVDGSGVVRPRIRWAPGKDEPVPAPARRLSAGWEDAVWVTGRAPEGLSGAGGLAPILESALAGRPPALAGVEALFGAHGEQVEAVAFVADELRRRAVGEPVTYVVNRNINYTNMCYFRCGFCAFSKGPRSLDLREDPYLMGIPEIVGWAREAAERGATEVTLQGGIHPEFTGDFYVEVVRAIKAELPDMHIHGFTPLEVWQGAETLGIGVRELLVRLGGAGLGTLPGTAAEILDDRVRVHLCPDKIRTAQWAEVMLTAHELGIRSTATIMFGHIDSPSSWARHLGVIAEIQRRTGGFTELVPLPFVHMGAPIYLRGAARPGPTWDEVVLVHAVSRIALDGLIPNVQASWVKLGLEGGSRLLDAGCNDLGGTLMGEIITRSAGAAHGTEVSPDELLAAARAAGRPAIQRTTLYDPVAEPVLRP